MDDEESRLEELYNRFRNSLTEPISERYFEEDELAALYDLAHDRDDNYVMLEVLLCGARLYPDSRLLAEKRLTWYMDSLVSTKKS